MATKSITTQAKPSFSKEELAYINQVKNLLRQLDLPMVYYILKTTTDENHPLSSSQIAYQLRSMIPHPNDNDEDKSREGFYPTRTISRLLSDYLTLLFEPATVTTSSGVQAESVELISKLLEIVMGGRIERCKPEYGSESSNQWRYYFEPIFSSSDMNLVVGSLMSSRYLSADEKEYLISRLRLLCQGFDFDKDGVEVNLNRNILDIIDSMPNRPKKNRLSNLPMDNSTLLAHIRQLNDAIDNECQIEITYGIYDKKTGESAVCFHERHPESPIYVLNPYALLWNDGEYYLLATHSGESRISYFRTDRIMTIQEHLYETKSGNFLPVAREKAPDIISNYICDTEFGHKKSFDAIGYSNKFPGMVIHNEVKLVDCTFECSTKALQILVDNFGAENISLRASHLKHPDSDNEYLEATIKRINYENGLYFSMQYLNFLTLLSPLDMVEEVKERLHAINQRYGL